MMETLIDKVNVTLDPCRIDLELLERVVDNKTLHVVRFNIEGEEPKETLSQDKEFILGVYNNCKLVIS